MEELCERDQVKYDYCESETSNVKNVSHVSPFTFDEDLNNIKILTTKAFVR
jgi:hypothetical protein